VTTSGKNNMPVGPVHQMYCNQGHRHRVKILSYKPELDNFD